MDLRVGKGTGYDGADKSCGTEDLFCKTVFRVLCVTTPFWFISGE